MTPNDEQHTASRRTRRDVMAVLASAPPARIQPLWESWADKPAYVTIRGPEVGLVMIRGRAGGGGAPFNLGEATVTRASVRLDSGEVGHAYCLGRDLEKARTAAVLDALWQHPEWAARVEDEIVAPLAAAQAADDAKHRAETAATRVDFFTMVRGED